MKARIIMSVVLLFFWGVIEKFVVTVSPIISATAASYQFQASDVSYVTSQYLMRWFDGSGLPSVILLAALLAIWWAPLKGFWKKITSAGAIGGGLLLLSVLPAHAFYQTTDRTEAYTILPNESAFWIPDVGDNKSSQTKFDSEDYLNSSKIAAKRFVIPHAKLGNSGGYLGWDAYVPTGRLIIVDRTPYSHEWVDASDRGTSKGKEGFPCQSKEGLDITAGATISASVTEENAAKFLYNFGTQAPKGDRSNQEVIFTSVYYGRPLFDVMNDFGRKAVARMVCNEIMARSFDQANNDAGDIQRDIETKMTAYLVKYGITVNFFGWADTFHFEDSVQKTVNDKYTAAALQPLMPTLQALMQLRVQEGLGKGLESKGLPIVVTPDMINALIGLAAPHVVGVPAPTIPAAK